MWESQVLLTDGQVVLRFSPTNDERSARYKWNILERAVKPKSKKKKKKKKKKMVGHRWIKLFMEIQWKLWLLWQPKCPIDLQRENACHHNSFSFYRMFLKLADKVDIMKSRRVRKLDVSDHYFFISTTRSGLIFLKPAKRWTLMKSHMSMKTGQTGTLLVTSSWLLKKAFKKHLISCARSILTLLPTGSRQRRKKIYFA